MDINMNICKYKSSCKLVGTTALIKLYNKNYCSGPLQENCKRRMLYLEGNEVAPTLLPNGHHFERRTYQRRKLSITDSLQSFFNDRRIFKRRNSDP